MKSDRPGKTGTKSCDMTTATRLIVSLAVITLAAAIPLPGKPPECDFSFTTRDGRETTLQKELASLQPDASVRLLIFDPDCGECRELEERLVADTIFSAGLADKSTAMIAIYPSDGIPEPDDINFAAYLRACGELPGEWIVGTDNGSISETDACTWENLPLLLEFRANEIADEE